MKYCLYRILGNDIPLRHSPSQTYTNLSFILTHEPEFADCEKRFLINRVVEKDKSDCYKALISEAGFSWDEISFDINEYKTLPSTIAKAHYLTNVNRARNKCIEIGKARCEYVLPFDGGSMFRLDGWDAFNTTLQEYIGVPYFLLGQWRISDYALMLNCSNKPILTELYHNRDGQILQATRELAIAFGSKHDSVFNENLPYGKVDKVELLWRLGVSGIWDNWQPPIKHESMKNLSRFAGTLKMAGWVARLPSGDHKGDSNNLLRGKHRTHGVQLLVNKVDSLLET